MRARRRIFGAALALAGAMLLLFFAVSPSKGGASPLAEAKTRETPELAAAMPTPPTERTRAMAPDGIETSRPALLERMRRERDAYRSASRFPHWSYPLTPDMGFLIDWNKTVASEVPFNEDDGAVKIRFDSDRARVMSGETLTAWVEATRKGKPVAFAVHDARVVVMSGANMGTAIPVAFHEASDHKMSARFTPSAYPALAVAAPARLEARVAIEGQSRAFALDFVYAPRRTIRVLAMREQIRDGSLVASLEVEVFERGVYTFYANLFGEGDAPIATTKLTYPLEPGKQSADLVFFGKAIFESGIDGPYFVRGIHGLKREEGGEMDLWWSEEQTLRTAAHSFTDFSSAEWVSEERSEKLAHFDRLIANLSRAR